MKSFKISVSTPEGSVYNEEGRYLSAPGIEGFFGIMADHAPFISELLPGKITITDKSEEKTVIVSKGKGFLEVSKNKVTVLLDSVQ
ncbi:MAG: F0F1 ATP synthase subunit epsilon [Candidatus Omnitrophica bacterium]|nr:F0F1 ATP synthase subunit epsilon [Candidatus Omnitrophota bacterium]